MLEEERQQRLASLSEQIEHEQEEWTNIGLPPIAQSYKQFFDPFYMMCSLIAINRVFIEILEVDQAEMDIRLREVLLNELKSWRKRLEQARNQAQADSIRQQITDGIFFRPPKDIQP